MICYYQLIFTAGEWHTHVYELGEPPLQLEHGLSAHPWIYYNCNNCYNNNNYAITINLYFSS